MNVVQSLLIGFFSSDINIILVYGMYDVKYWRVSEASKTHSGVKINEIVYVGRFIYMDVRMSFRPLTCLQLLMIRVPFIQLFQ